MRHLAVLLLALAGCAHSPLSARALEETKIVAFVARIADDAGPRSNVFRDDPAYRDRLKRLDEKEGDRRLSNALAVGSFNRRKNKDGKEYGEPELLVHTISRFELADSLRSTVLSQLDETHPWDAMVHPVDVARVLESFLVQEVPANAPDYERLASLGADTVVEIVVEEYGLRSTGGRAGAYLIGHARLFRIHGGELYRRNFYSDDLSAGLEPLDPFEVRRNVQLFVDRMRQIVAGVSVQIAKDLTPEQAVAAKKVEPPKKRAPSGTTPQSDDPL